MQSAWKQLHPQDSFKIVLASPLTSEDEQILTFLYQPLIGIDAFSIYHLFLSLVKPGQFASDDAIHAELFNQLNIDLPRLFHGRVKLEGLGLLAVYVREHQQRRQFIYELNAPLKAQDFFNDDVLSLLLLERVGERRYQQLSARFALPNLDTTGFTEVTKKFLDVYTFHEEALTSQNKVLEENKANFPVTSAKALSAVSSSFDWPYFLSLLDGLYVDKTQVESELRETIFTLHQLYGINELTMKQFVEREIDFVTNKVDLNKLRQQVIQTYHQEQKQHTRVVEQAEAQLSESDQAQRRRNTLQLDGFNAGEIDVISASETYPPMIYMTAIRKQKGGFITNNERWALENIVKKSGLPDSVINILVHYVLVVQNNATFDEKYSSKIANNWAQEKIYSPEAALKKVKEANQKGTSAQGNQSKPRANWKKSGSQRKESLPAWVEQQKQETPVSQEEEDYFKEQLRLLRSSGNEGED